MVEAGRKLTTWQVPAGVMAGMRRWFRRASVAFWVLLVVLLAAARLGILPNWTYQAMYAVVAMPGRMLGREEAAAVRYYVWTCRPYRYPVNISMLESVGIREYNVEKTIFTCRMD